MKKAIAISAVLLVAAFGAQAQRVAGTNINGTERPLITDLDTGAAVGSDFSVAVYAGADAGSLVAVKTGSILAQGLFNLNDVNTGLAAGSTGFFQVKAWETAFGATYDEAFAVGRTGESNVFDMTVSTDVAGQPLGIAPNLVAGGLQAFTVEIVPEPSTIVLGILGAAALLIRRRK
jgi:hypothetical protein